MNDLKLDFDEGILLQTTDVIQYSGNNELEIDELFLTNKNIIFIYEKSNGIFSKSETIVDKITLDSIRIVNGVVQIQQVNDNDYGNTLQVLYKNGKRELFEFSDSPKKEYPKWKLAIAEAVSMCADGKGSTTNIASEIIPGTEATAASPTASTEKKSVRYCAYCGTKLVSGARFCESCGKPVGNPVETSSDTDVGKPHTNEEPVNEPITKRKTVYEGYIHKCPSCGEVLNSFNSICPTCGYELHG